MSMRILIATTNRSVVGGVETHLQAVLPLLRDLGHDICLLYANAAVTGQPAIDDACSGLSLAVGAQPGRALSVAQRWGPDVVYLHGLPDPGSEAELAEHFPTVLFAHNYHGTCIGGSKCHAARGYRTCERQLGPGCLAAYLPYRCGGVNPVTMLALYRTQRQRQANLRRYRSVLVASQHMAAEYHRHGIPEDRLRVVPLFPPDACPDIEPPAPKPLDGRVLLVSRLHPLKGAGLAAETVARAAAELGRALTLVVAGDGPCRRQCEVESARNGVPTEFLGWVGPERRQAEMRAADVLLVPSLWPEPFGLVGIEAGCVGLPAAAFAVGGIPDWLIPDVSGELASQDRLEPRCLAQAVARTLSSPDHHQRLRIGAWEMASRFSKEAHLDRLMPILESAAADCWISKSLA